MSGRSGKVRVARLTDLAALGELSRLCQQETADARSLGLPGQRPADRRVQPVPAAARRLPAARPAVRLRGGGRPVGPHPGRARHGPRRVDDRRARRDRDGRGRRHPLPARPAHPARRCKAGRDPLPCRLRRRGRQRRAVHAGRLRPLRRGAPAVPSARRRRCPSRGPTSRPPRPGSGPRSRSTRSRWPGSTRRSPRSRSSVSRPTGSATGSARDPAGGCPRSSLAPILRFADVEAFVQERRAAGRTAPGSTAFVQVGVAKEDQPHYLKVLARPESDVAPLVEYGLGVISARTRNGGPQRSRGHLARPDLRGPDRSAARGGRLRRRVDGHAADEGDRSSGSPSRRSSRPSDDGSIPHQGRNR